jgi:two-component system chemotaxis response regulator CheY
MAQKLIMVIDDSRSLREVVRIALATAGYEVVEAADGQEALGRLGERRFHLIICDVNMPVMDGISFVRHVKQLPRHRFVPIIMLTTETRENRKWEGQQAGAKAWVVKPFRPEQMLQAVAKLVLP